MSDLRGFSIVRQAVDLETIEEEPDDYHSQHSRAGARSLRNGIEGVVGAGHVRRGSKSGAGAEWGAEGQGRQPQSQTNTITTYATQYSDCFDVNTFAGGLQQQQPVKSGGAAQGAVGLVRVKRHRFDDDHNLLLEDDLRGTIGTVGTGGTTTTATSAQHDSGAAGKRLRADKWDQNYYYNNYGPSPGDPLQVYKWSNSQNWTAAQRRLVRERQQQEQRSRRRRRCCNCSVM